MLGLLAPRPGTLTVPSISKYSRFLKPREPLHFAALVAKTFCVWATHARKQHKQCNTLGFAAGGDAATAAAGAAVAPKRLGVAPVPLPALCAGLLVLLPAVQCGCESTKS